MDKRKVIIGLCCMLLIFGIIITIIIVKHTKQKPVEKDPEKHYAVNITATPTPIVTITEAPILVQDHTIYNTNKLSDEQRVVQSNFKQLLSKRISQDNLDIEKIEILDYQEQENIFVEVTEKDATKRTYVVIYDSSMYHNFLRCVTLDEYNYYNSDDAIYYDPDTR